MNVNHLHYYKYRYLNCFKAQYLAELLDKGIPVDYLFYDAYVDSKVILEDIIGNGLDRWTMRVSTLNDLGMVGIYVIHRYFPTISSAYPYMKKKLAANKKLYMWVSQNHLPHLNHLPDGVHVIGLHSYSEQDGTFDIFDVPGISRHSYKEIHIQESFDHLEDIFKYIYYLYDEEYTFTEEIVEILINKFENSFMQFSEDFSMYDKILDLLYQPQNEIDLESIYYRIENALAVIAGSRYHFAKFLTITGYSDTEILQQISNSAVSLQKIMMKARAGANIGHYQIKDKIMKLKSLELENMKKIKGVILQNKESRSIRKVTKEVKQSTIADMKLTCKKLDLNKVKLEWSEVVQDDFLYGYEIYVNDTWHGTTLLNFYEIVNLDYDKDYYIQVRVKNFSGYIEQYNDSVTIHTEYKDTNYALGKPVYCSSEETSIFIKENVNNGIDGTRWGSIVGSDQEWIYIDLLEPTRIQRVVLNWESHAQSYTIDVSDDNVNWRTVISNDNGVGGVEEFNNLQDIECRYIKMNGRKRGTTWGYSLWDFEVYAV